MAAIDGLLALLDLQPADGLVLEAGKAPALVLGGQRRALTMQPIDGGVLDAMLREVMPVDKMAVFEGEGAAEMSHASSKVGTVVIRASRASGTLVLRVRRGVASPEEQATLRRAVALPEPPPSSVGASALNPAGAALSSTSLWHVISRALQRGASDVFISTGAAPAVRVAGEVMEMAGAPPTPDELLAFLGVSLSPAHRRTFEETGSADLALEAGTEEIGEAAGRRFRVNLFKHLEGMAAAIRPLWVALPTPEELHLPPRLTKIVSPASGLVLVAGLAGSGKSTTLAVLVEHLNRTQARHIVTLEDPIEYVFRRQRSVIHQREVGTHVESFASGLRAALRESPNVILVGEMRDPETIALALTAAETGHLVLSTIHSAGAATAIDRIVDVFPQTQQQQVRAQLGNVLRTLVTQRLLSGKVPGTRVPVLEILQVSTAVASHIREGKTHMLQNQMQAGADDGMLPFDRNLVEMVRRGLISATTAVEAAQDKDYVTGALGGVTR